MSQRCQSRHFAPQQAAPYSRLDCPVALGFQATPKRRHPAIAHLAAITPRGPSVDSHQCWRRCRHIMKLGNSSTTCPPGAQGEGEWMRIIFAFTLAAVRLVPLSPIGRPCPFRKVRSAPAAENRPPATPTSAVRESRPAVRRGAARAEIHKKNVATVKPNKTPGGERLSARRVNLVQFLAAVTASAAPVRFSKFRLVDLAGPIGGSALRIEPGLSRSSLPSSSSPFLTCRTSASQPDWLRCEPGRVAGIPSRCSRWDIYCRSENKTSIAKPIAWRLASMIFLALWSPPDRTDITIQLPAEAAARPELPNKRPGTKRFGGTNRRRNALIDSAPRTDVGKRDQS